MSEETTVPEKPLGTPEKKVEFFGHGSEAETISKGIEVGGGFSIGDLSMRRLLTMAAVSPRGAKTRLMWR